MIDVSNRVLTNVQEYMSGICKNVKNNSSLTPAEFPAMSVEQIDNADVAVDLENAENAVRSVIEIQAFSNKSIIEARKIINMACDSMRIMGYERNYGPQKITNANDVNVFRMVARFSRIVSSVDEIKKFETKGA